MKQLSGTIHTSVSTRVEVVLIEMKLGNIKVKKCYDISFLFSLSYKDHETLILFTQDLPHPFLYLNFVTGETRQKPAFVRVFLALHMTKLLP